MQRDREKGMELNIRRERKEISQLEKALGGYKQSLELLEQISQKRGASSDAMVEEKQDELPKSLANVPNARFMSSEEVEEDLIKKHGSKMAHLFVYVKQLCENEENRIIVFSQWDRMLGLVGTHRPLLLVADSRPRSEPCCR